MSKQEKVGPWKSEKEQARKKDNNKKRKQANASKLKSKPGQGRPVGWLVAWLLKGRQRGEHGSVEITLEERTAARDRVVSEGGAFLLRSEVGEGLLGEPDEEP